MFCEIRPRLGTVNAFIAKTTKSKVNIAPDGGSLILSNDDEIQTFQWPTEVYGGISPGSIHALLAFKDQDQDSSLSFRFKLIGSHLSLLPLHQLRSKSLKFIRPCRLPSSNQANEVIGKIQDLFCAKCRAKVNCDPLDIKRCLPLPAADWRNGIQDWFCACADHGSGSKQECSKDEDDTQWDILAS